jgi:predicted PurR-regulated permease PerM
VIAATAIVVACLVLIIAPLALVAVNFADAVEILIAKLKAENFTLPVAPPGIREWPVVGERIFAAWNQIAGDLAANIIKFQKPILHAMGLVIVKLASISGGVLSFVASVILSGFFLTMSDTTCRDNTGAGKPDRRRERAWALHELAGTTVRNVSRGVIGVAFLQTILCALCFAFFGIPARGALTFLVFVLCLMQLGPGLILVPASYGDGSHGRRRSHSPSPSWQCRS